MAEAYLHWVNGLSKEQLGSLGYLYDGGFDQPFANDSGFGWVARPPHNSGIRISRGDTYGASNDQALRLDFRGKRVRFAHVYQQVFLAPGRYSVSGRVRPDQLRARRGLQWRLYCSAGTGGTLEAAEPGFAARAQAHLARLAEDLGLGGGFRVATTNTFPSAAGIASSASGFAAFSFVSCVRKSVAP